MPSVPLMAQNQGQRLGTGLSPRWGPAEAGCLLLPHPGAKLPVAPGSGPARRRALSPISKPLLFKGLLELPALLLFWCLRRATPPSSCISLLPSTCRGHAALPWPRQQPRAPLGNPAGFLGAPQGAASSPRGGCVPAVRASTSQLLHLALASKRLALAARKEIKRCKGI